MARALLVLVVLVVPMLPASGQDPDPEILSLFWAEGCPHCAAEKEFLEELSEEYPDLTIHQHEVRFDEDGRALFVSVMEALGEEPRAVPTTVFAGRVWVGFDNVVAEQITAAVAGRSEASEDTRQIDVPLLGEVDVASESLLPATIVIALVDGFNPCSLWALSILLALVVRSDSRKRVLAVGGTFLAVTTMLYGAYIIGLYGALTYASRTTWIRVAMAAVALGFGTVNVKDYFRFRQGVSLTIPDRAKPRLYERMRHVAADRRPLSGVLLGTAGLAVGVSLLETPCTAGYPLLWADLLSAQEVGFAAGGLLFGVYMLVFLLDELAIFGAAVVTMRVWKLHERQGRVLKLVSGVLMMVLAFTLIFVPQAMDTIAGALWVGAVSAGIVSIVLVVDRRPGGRRPSTRTARASR